MVAPVPGHCMVRPTRTVTTQWLVIGSVLFAAGIAIGHGLIDPLALVLGGLLATIGLGLGTNWSWPSISRSPELATDGGTTDIELVVAIIRPAKLNDVKRALAEAGAPSLTVTNVSGRGSQPTETGQWRGAEYIVDLHQKVKLECAVPATKSPVVLDAIQDAANTGEPGDGKIFVLPITEACRVSTDERGIEAM